METRLTQASDQLHERVQRFAELVLEAGYAAPGDAFEQLALDIARFQAEASPGFARLLAARGARLDCLDDLPPVPSDAFRLARVATFPDELARVRFYTSGTTGSERGTHAMRRTDTYAKLSLAFGRQALLRAGTSLPAAVAIALAPRAMAQGGSSLGHMMARFMEAFDGEPLDAAEPRFDHEADARWLLGEQGVDQAGLARALQAAHARALPVLLLGTAFALVRLLDELAGAALPLPPDSVVMQTGGFKGKSREVSFDELRVQLSRAFELEPGQIVGEYGMTELTSQLYQASAAGSALGQSRAGAPPHVYYEPPWLRVTPVDPLSLLPVPQGEVGLARFVDLGNIDSAVSVVTQDLVRRAQGGIELLGRQPGAPARGCSLAIEALLG
ncbi:MAG TPA: acyl-protein synthetase [Polyangiaceae bacterium]